MVVAVVGVLLVGSQLADAWPRDIDVVYEVGPGVRELDVDYLQRGEAVSSVRFTRSVPKAPVFRHVARLQPGEYQIHITLYGQDGEASEHTRRLAVPTPGVMRVDLKDATWPSE